MRFNLHSTILIMNTNQKSSKKAHITKELNDASGDLRHLVKNKINVLKNMRSKMDESIKNNKGFRVYDNLMSLVSDKNILKLAYGNIKSNKGSMAPGFDSNNIPDGFDKTKIEKLSEELKTGIYRFPKVRRTWIPKPGKNIKWDKNNLIKSGRPPGMPDFKAKIVQEAIRLILESIYEPIFSLTSANFGFRSGLGCHNSLFTIRPQTQGMNLAIEGDIKGAFDNLDHDILIKILRKRIIDEKFLDFIYNCCKAGIFDELQNKTIDPLTGVPQGGIMSPLLWNIYMQEFDDFIHNDIQLTFDLINKAQKREKTNFSPNRKLYKNRLYRRSITLEKLTRTKAGREIKHLPEQEKQLAIKLKEEYQIANKLLLKTKSKDLTKIRLRFYYIRYADDWVFFTNAKILMAKLIKNKITAFLKDHLKLTLSQDKTKITTLDRDRVKFLGFSISKLKTKKITTTKYGGTRRSTGHKVNIGIDKDRVLGRMLWKGFLDKNDKPREQPALSILSDYEIIMKYNSMIRRYVNYYAPIIDFRSDLNYFVYILEYSCYKTLCQKHRTTIKKLLKKHGKPLSATYSNINPTNNLETQTKTITLLDSTTYAAETKKR